MSNISPQLIPFKHTLGSGTPTPKPEPVGPVHTDQGDGYTGHLHTHTALPWPYTLFLSCPPNNKYTLGPEGETYGLCPKIMWE